jgi:hypothetical protein
VAVSLESQAQQTPNLARRAARLTVALGALIFGAQLVQLGQVLSWW